jgi:hypothetical protein
MREQYQQEPGLEWSICDCTSLPFATDSINYVFDKGTFDCLSAGDNPSQTIGDYFASVGQCLKVDGCLVIVSFGSPESRIRFFKPVEASLKLVDTIKVPNLRKAAHFIYVFRKQPLE